MTSGINVCSDCGAPANIVRITRNGNPGYLTWRIACQLCASFVENQRLEDSTTPQMLRADCVAEWNARPSFWLKDCVPALLACPCCGYPADVKFDIITNQVSVGCQWHLCGVGLSVHQLPGELRSLDTVQRAAQAWNRRRGGEAS